MRVALAASAVAGASSSAQPGADPATQPGTPCLHDGNCRPIGNLASSDDAAQPSISPTDGSANIRAYGGKCDGVFDNGPLATMLLRTHRTVVFSFDGCAAPYLVNTTIVVPAGGEVVGSGMMSAASTPVSVPVGIATTAAVDTFAAAGDRTAYRNLAIKHTGSAGKVIDLLGTSFAVVEGDDITDVSTANSDPAVYGYGAQHGIHRTRFNHYRRNAYAIAVDSAHNTSLFLTASVNWDIGDDFIVGSKAAGMGPPGPGILVYSSSGTATQAPQGIYIHNTTIQTEDANNLVVQQVVNLLATDNTFDSGAGIVLQPVAGGQGLFGVQIHGGYVSTPTNATNGSCIAQSGNAMPITNLQVQGVIVSLCGYGIATIAGNNTGMQIQNNVFFSIARVAVNVQNATKATISGNMAFNVAGANMVLADGPSGGPYVVGANQWDPMAGMVIKETAPQKFSFGNDNTGKLLAGTAAANATFASTGTHCVAIAIPHGLAGTPNPDKTLLTPRVLTGGFSNVTVTAATPDATYVHAQVCATVTARGAVRVVAQSSL